MSHEAQLTRLPVLQHIRPAVRDPDRSGSVLSGWDHPFKVDVADWMVFDFRPKYGESEAEDDRNSDLLARRAPGINEVWSLH